MSRDVLHNIATQVSKLPESAHIETMTNAIKDKAVNILTEIQSHIGDLNQSAQRHENELARLADVLSNWEMSLTTPTGQESENTRQLQAVESIKFIEHVDSVTAILKKKLDAITNVLKEQERSHYVQHESLVENVRSQQLALVEVHQSVEAFAAKAVDIVALVDQKMTRAEYQDESNPRKTWLSQFVTQLISSGITSAITGAVVLVSVRSKLDQSDKFNGWSVPKSEICVRAFTDRSLSAGTAHQQTTAAPREEAEDEARANTAKTASNQNEPLRDEVKVLATPTGPKTTPSASLLQSNPSWKASPAKGADLPTSSAASLTSRAQSRRQPSSQESHKDFSNNTTAYVPKNHLASTSRFNPLLNLSKYCKRILSALPRRLFKSSNPEKPSNSSTQAFEDFRQQSKDLWQPSKHPQQSSKDYQQSSEDLQQSSKDLQQSSKHLQQPFQNSQQLFENPQQSFQNSQQSFENPQQPFRDFQQSSNNIQQPFNDPKQPSRSLGDDKDHSNDTPTVSGTGRSCLSTPKGLIYPTCDSQNHNDDFNESIGSLLNVAGFSSDLPYQPLKAVPHDTLNENISRNEASTNPSLLFEASRSSPSYRIPLQPSLTLEFRPRTHHRIGLSRPPRCSKTFGSTLHLRIPRLSLRPRIAKFVRSLRSSGQQ